MYPQQHLVRFHLTVDLDGVGVGRVVGREADVNLVVLHDLADGAALGSDEARKDAVVDIHRFRHTVLLEWAKVDTIFTRAQRKQHYHHSDTTC